MARRLRAGYIAPARKTSPVITRHVDELDAETARRLRLHVTWPDPVELEDEDEAGWSRVDV